jgi:hypothetical protein
MCSFNFLKSAACSSDAVVGSVHTHIQVFCIADEDAEADELKTDVRKFLYDLRMEAEVIIVTMKSWDVHRENRQASSEMTGREDAMETFSKARKRIMQHAAGIRKTASSSNQSETEESVFDDQQVKTNSCSCICLTLLFFSADVEHTKNGLGEARVRDSWCFWHISSRVIQVY